MKYAIRCLILDYIRQVPSLCTKKPPVAWEAVVFWFLSRVPPKPLESNANQEDNDKKHKAERMRQETGKH